MLQLALPDGRRVPLVGDVTIGRASGNTITLSDPTVSRQHARIRARDEAVTIEDSGSIAGTAVDGGPVVSPTVLSDGKRIVLGAVELVVEGPRPQAAAGHTIVVPDDPSGEPAVVNGPRLRPGYALKRLEAAEGERRWVLKSLRSARFVRLAAAEAELVQELDGRPAAELVSIAARRFGPEGPVRLARLLSELADRGFLAGVEETEQATARRGLLRRFVGPREYVWDGAGGAIDRLYRSTGRYLMGETPLIALGFLAAAGLGVFAYLVAGRYGTPFVVAHKAGVGALVFLFGRLAIAAVHEAAHGVVLASYGRRVGRAGLKLVAIFPYVYVDTSDAWFESRARRIAISAAGPVSDLTLGAVFALCCLWFGPGPIRDVFFQLAFAAYMGALFNLNPLVERDGYHVLVDVLRQPGLRRRAREQLRRRLNGEPRAVDATLLERYAVAGVLWSVLALVLGVAISLHYEATLAQVVPAPFPGVLIGMLWLLLVAPLAGMVGAPILQRWRERGAEHARA
jgi:putative peptide zinc metalloprotease protein